MEPVDLVGLCRNIARRFESEHPVALTRMDPCNVMANREGLEQALLHLVQNAIDTSAQGMPVFLDVSADGIHGRVDVVDTGTGMDAEFIRSRLFKPFASSKPNGFGIGALEARELIRAMNGRLDVQSRPDLGTRFTVVMPLASAAKFISGQSESEAA